MPEFYAKNTGIYQDDKKVTLKGINWFGMETEVYAFHGLWSVSFKSILDFIQSNKFNAIRIPLSLEVVFGLDTVKCKSINTDVNPELNNVTPGQLLDKLVNECAKRSILVMPDIHRFTGDGSITELWYDEKNPESKLIEAWKLIVRRYINNPNVFAVDIKNEPHGSATWGNSNPKTDWNKAAERIGNAILDINPKMLIFVEGVEQGSWWGGSLSGVAKYPIKLKIPNKLVYSPHVYGPSVCVQKYFLDNDFPSNMKPIWDKDFGFIKNQSLGTVVIGEWGGKMTTENKDDVWQNALGDYIKENQFDFFYWCLNPNSADTFGVLEEDWKTPSTKKLQLLERICPNPTKFVFTSQTPSSQPTQNAIKPTQTLPVSQPKPNPTTASSNVSIIDTNQWYDGTFQYYQQELTFKNNTTHTIPDIQIWMSLPSGKLQQSWNCKCTIQDQSFTLSFPQWVIDNQGLKPGEMVKFGYIVQDKKPVVRNVYEQFK